MENRNDDFLELLAKTKDCIEKIQITTKEKEKIENSIKNIRDEVTKINDFLKKFDKVIYEETSKLNTYKSQINNIQFELLKKDTDKIKSIIQSNLPNTIESREYSNKIELYRVISVNKNKIMARNESIGSIEIKELESNKNKVIIKIKDDDMKIYLEESFEVIDPLRIYDIIAYLNMKLNYKTT